MDTLNNNLFDAIFAPKHENKGTSSLKSTFKDSYFSLLDKKEEDACPQQNFFLFFIFFSAPSLLPPPSVAQPFRSVWQSLPASDGASQIGSLISRCARKLSISIFLQINHLLFRASSAALLFHSYIVGKVLDKKQLKQQDG